LDLQAGAKESRHRLWFYWLNQTKFVFRVDAFIPMYLNDNIYNRIERLGGLYIL
jgi:hypothetical protein